MKAKLVKNVLYSKFNNFVNSIEDKAIQNEIREGTIITGGCIVSLLKNEKPNDYDLYFTTKELTAKVADYYVNQFNKNNPSLKSVSGIQEIRPQIRIEKDGRVKIIAKSSGVVSESNDTGYQYFEGLGPEDPNRDKFVDDMITVFKDQYKTNKKEAKRFRPIFMTSNAITLSDNIQLIIRFYGSPEEIHKNFDFIHCYNYWTSFNNELVLKKEALESILTNTLIYSGSLYPICSLIRMRKFVIKGWSCSAGQILKICYHINSLNLSDPKVLEDQLMGVDVAYFMELIDKIKNQNPKVIDSAYICNLIDEVF